MNTTVATIVLLALFAGAIPESSFVRPGQNSDRSQLSLLRTNVEDERGTVALDQALREISNPFTILCVAARPGDEDDGTLAYFRKKLGARVVVLFATRGEAEDSPTRAELDQDLGAVRTREAIEAARVIGADVSFLNLRDIGYSKSADEVLSIWGHDDALRRMVRAIRSLRPDVIITNHRPKTGEGTEQAVARLALEAFHAAGETKLAPEAGSDSWSVRRYFERTDDAATDVKIDLNEYDNVRGLTYTQIGLAAHHRFQSRGAGLDRPTPDRETSYYKLIASAADDELKTEDGSSTGLLGGLKLSENLSRTIGAPRVGDSGLVNAIANERLIDVLTEKLVELRAEGTAEVMRERYGPEFVRVVRFTAAIERAIVLALGLNLEVKLSDTVVVPGQTVSARIVFRNGGLRAFPVAFSAPERLPIPDKNAAYKTSDVIGVGPRGITTKEFDYEIPKDTLPTVPYPAHLYDEEYYAIGSTLPGAQPGAPFGYRLIVSADIGLGHTSIRLSVLARFDVAPPVEISTIPFALVADWSKQREVDFPLRVRNRTPGKLAGALWVVPIALADDEYDPVHIAFAREDEEVTIKMKLRLPILKPPLAPDVLIEFRRERPAAPDPLGSAKIAVKASGFEVADGLKVGYIRGLDDWLSFALSELGIEHSELKIDDISATEHGNAVSTAQSRIGCGELTRYDTIVVDSNAYFARPELNRHNRCLLRYVRQGGNIVVLSQIPEDWNLVLANTQFAPYPIKLTKDRITIETAAVKILDGDHLLISKPNKVEAKDFDGWVVDRAVNVPREWSSEYAALLESGDHGEEPTRGSLLVARYGEGTYIYVSLSLRRQLLAGTAGAYRIFADLVSYPKVIKSMTKPQ
jgi:LmbE family N-acetylglucosaminyl deacetylase